MIFEAVKPLEVNKIEYPIAEVERIVKLIIELAESNDNYEMTTLQETINILNEGLKLLIRPYLILENNGKL